MENFRSNKGLNLNRMNKNAEIDGNSSNRNGILQYLIIKHDGRLKTRYNTIRSGYRIISDKLNRLRTYYIKLIDSKQQCLKTI